MERFFEGQYAHVEKTDTRYEVFLKASTKKEYLAGKFPLNGHIAAARMAHLLNTDAEYRHSMLQIIRENSKRR